MTDEALFAARNAVLNGLGASDGIGTLSERSLHAILKYAFEPDISFHEVPVCGYVADICRGNTITEIQTHDLGRLRDKLAAFLPAHRVTVVYPIAGNKRIVLTDPATGEVLRTRRSPLHGDIADAYLELLRIKEFLTNKNLSVTLLFLDVTEYRKTVPKSRHNRRGTECIDRIPEKLLSEVRLGGKGGFSALCPQDLPSPFTAKDFSAAIKQRGMSVSAGIKLLCFLSLAERVGKKGNAYLYKIR